MSILTLVAILCGLSMLLSCRTIDQDPSFLLQYETDWESLNSSTGIFIKDRSGAVSAADTLHFSLNSKQKSRLASVIDSLGFWNLPDSLPSKYIRNSYLQVRRLGRIRTVYFNSLFFPVTHQDSIMRRIMGEINTVLQEFPEYWEMPVHLRD